MKLRQIANNLSRQVNPNTVVTIRASTGYTIGEGAYQIPTYAESVEGVAQLQSIAGGDLEKSENINLQEIYKVLYISGQLYGKVRLDDKGGDLVIINEETWLTVKVLERWPDWCKVLLCLQLQ